MKCQMCNGEGGKIPHPEKYGSYREDCPACNGTGEQPPVDKKLLRYRVLRASTHEGVSISLLEHEDGDIYKVNEVDKCVTTLKSELQAARGEIERLKSERLDFENREGAICPEDVGFEEYIRTLEKRVEELEKEHKGKCPVCMVRELPEEQGGPDPEPIL